MSYTYEKLTESDRKQIAEQQWRQFEAEIFGHELNLARLAAIPAPDPGTDERKQHDKLVENSEAAIKVLTETIEVTKATVEKLPDNGSVQTTPADTLPKQ